MWLLMIKKQDEELEKDEKKLMEKRRMEGTEQLEMIRRGHGIGHGGKSTMRRQVQGPFCL